MAKTRVLSAKQIMLKKYSMVEMDGYWEQLFGKVERNFKMMVYGPSESGKSTLVLKYNKYLAEKHKRKVLYNSHEEGLNSTLQARIAETETSECSIYFAEQMPFDELMIEIKRRKAHVVVIDSVKFMGLTYQQMVQLITTHKTKAFIFIGHGDKRGDFDNVHIKDINKACDIKVFLQYGKATITSRYSPQPKHVELFKPKQIGANPAPQQGGLGI